MQQSFRRTLIGVLVVLGLLVAGFATLDRLQGPKLSSEQVDTTAIVNKPAQTLRLFTSERITTVRRAQVRVTPAAAFTVSTSGQLIVLQFTNPLRYSTSYRVAIDGVASADDGAASTLGYSFTTASPQIYYLHRSPGGDQIFRTSIGSPGQTLVYSAPRIQDFAVFDRALAVVTLSRGGASSLFVVGSKGVVDPITLPGPGTVNLVRSNRDTGILGFTFSDAGDTTKAKYTNVLFMVDPNGTAVPSPVKGLDGKPLPVINWYFVPASNDVVVQAADGDVLLLDTTNPSSVTPIGSYLALDSVATDGRSFVVTDNNGPVSVAVPSGRKTHLVASKLDGATVIGGAAQSLPVGWLQIDSVYDAKIRVFTEHLAFDNGRSAHLLFATPNPRGSVDSFQDSPNNQYVSIETTPDAARAKPDGYEVNGRSTSVSTAFVDVSTGALVKSVEGFDVSW